MVHGEAGMVRNPGLWLRARAEVLAHSQCKLIVMEESQGRVDLASQARLFQLIHMDCTLHFPLKHLTMLVSELLSTKESCFKATSENIVTGITTTLSESCIYSPVKIYIYIYSKTHPLLLHISLASHLCHVML